jgi:predicted nucleic acid-binding protein
MVDEAPREALLALLERDPVILVWWGTAVECVSAIARREREGALAFPDATAAFERLRALAGEWQEVLPSDPVRMTAQRLLRVHPLRAADSLQLAAAIVAAEGDPATLEFVGLDDRLNDAAAREGFRVVRG